MMDYLSSSVGHGVVIRFLECLDSEWLSVGDPDDLIDHGCGTLTDFPDWPEEGVKIELYGVCPWEGSI